MNIWILLKKGGNQLFRSVEFALVPERIILLLRLPGQFGKLRNQRQAQQKIAAAARRRGTSRNAQI